MVEIGNCKKKKKRKKKKDKLKMQLYVIIIGNASETKHPPFDLKFSQKMRIFVE